MQKKINKFQGFVTKIKNAKKKSHNEDINQCYNKMIKNINKIKNITK